MSWSLFKGKLNSDNILVRADAALAQFTAEHTKLEAEKQQKMQRQVELWSILTPSEELRTEYRTVAGDIAFIIKKMLCLDEHLKNLKLARFHAANGEKSKLEQLLEIADPCSNISADIPQVTY